MVKYISIRVVGVFLTLLLFNLVLFYIGRIIGMRFRDIPLSDKFIEASGEYFTYIKNIISEWNWGNDKKDNSAWAILRERSTLTLRLTFLSTITFIFGGISLGALAAVYRDSWFDQLINGFILLFSSIPAFILVMVLIVVFGYQLEWLPPINPSRHILGTWEYLKGFIIPVVSIAGFPMAHIMRLVRGEIVELYQSDYILLLRTKGLSTRQVVVKHFLKDATVSIFPEIMPMFMYVLVTSFIVEKVYNINGIAKWLFDSIFVPSPGGGYWVVIDLAPMVLLGTFYTFITLFTGLILDIIQVYMDPRIKLKGKKADGN